MRSASLTIAALLLIAAAPSYTRWGEFSYGGRNLIYLEEDSERPALSALVLCSTSSNVLEWRHYGATDAALVPRLGPGQMVAGCDRACRHAAQAIARRNGQPDTALTPREGRVWSLKKVDALNLLRRKLAELDSPRAIDASSAERERIRAIDMVTRFERQCGGRI
jgi:hypothetical protein